MRIPARQLPVGCRKHICMQSHGRPPWRAWKHYHHHHMWRELLPRGALVLHDRAPLSNGRPTRSLIVPSPATTVAAQDKAGQRWDQLDGWALNERQRLFCGLLYIRYRSNTVDILSFKGAKGAVCFDGCQFSHITAAWVHMASCSLAEEELKTWQDHIPVRTKSCKNIYVKSGEQSFLASQHWYAHLFQDCNLLQTF